MIKRLSRFNVYAERSKKYVGTLQLFLLLSIFISNNLGLQLDWWHYIIIFLVSSMIFIIVGYVDVKIGIMSQEQKCQGDKNPIFDKFFEQLERIENKLKEKKQ